MDFASRRSPVIGRGGMVAASQPLAVAAGLETLRKGGNAADAAVSTAAALNVTEPAYTGLGGDCFALYFDASSRQVAALNGSGRAPAALTLERVSREGISGELPLRHAHTVTVPGACAGWCDLIERFGRLTLSEILQPAIRLAEEGFPVAPLTAYLWEADVKEHVLVKPGGEELTVEGRAPRPGEIFRNPGLARTLEAIAGSGKAAFYEGPIADAIVAVLREAGGCMTAGDLARHCSTWEEPIHTTYRNIRVWECPPNGQGITALLALNILEGFDLQTLPPLSARRLHLEIEALRLAFADARWYVADPVFRPAPLQELLSKQYADQRRSLIDPRKAVLDVKKGRPAVSSDTVYFSVVDKDGNACSFINSNYHSFGTGIVPHGWGFCLQNRGHTFRLQAEHPNSLEPGKRPYHTIIPALATREDDHTLYACFGVMGGFMQPQGHLQVLSALVDDGLDPQAALDRPRFCIDANAETGQVGIEEGIPVKVMAELAAMGHRIAPVSGYDRGLFGRGQVIIQDAQSGALWGGSDPRSDGCVMTLL